MPQQRKIAQLGLHAGVLPWTRAELPGWGKLYRIAGLGFDHNQRWADAGWKKLSLKDGAGDVWLDLSAAFERGTYFLGRYQELELLLIMRAVLKPGGQFIDGGANIGLLSMFAASLVGPNGRVDAFEPNDAVRARVLEHADINKFDQIVVHACGLSDEAADLTFRVLDGGSESGTLANLDGPLMAVVTEEATVRVERGDDLLLDALSADQPTFIKLDVEGYERQAVSGLLKVIEKTRPVMTTEYQRHLTPREELDELFRLLSARGYAAHHIDLRRSGLSHRLWLTPIADADALFERTDKSDILWLLPEAKPLFEDALAV